MVAGLLKIISVCMALLVFIDCRNNTGRELIIISPHSPEIKTEFTTGFSSWYKARTGSQVSIKWLDVGGTGEVVEYVRSRNAGNRQSGGVDIFFGGGEFPYMRLSRDSLLAPYYPPDSILMNIPQDINGAPIRGAGSLYYGAAVSGFGIIYNKEICRLNHLRIPSGWEDLTSPECFGWISSGDPRYSGSVHMMYEIILQAFGWEKGWDMILRMGANIQGFTKGASSSAKAVSIGQAAMGLAIDFYAFIEIERYGKNRLGFIMPEGKSVVSADGIAILENAPSPDIAGMFMEYVLGEGQKLWILKKGASGGPVKKPLCRYPVDRRLYDLDTSQLATVGNPFASKSSFRYNAQLGSRRWAILNDMLASFVITPHTALKKNNRDMLESGVSLNEISQKIRITVSEEEALKLSEQWGDTDFALNRIRIMNKWSKVAAASYKAGHQVNINRK